VSLLPAPVVSVNPIDSDYLLSGPLLVSISQSSGTYATLQTMAIPQNERNQPEFLVLMWYVDHKEMSQEDLVGIHNPLDKKIPHTLSDSTYGSRPMDDKD